MNNESTGQDSNSPKDRLDMETGKLVPLNQSPTVAKVTEPPKAEQPEGMWFTDALNVLLAGAKAIRRLTWPEGECVFFQPVRFSPDSEETTDILTLRKADGSNHNWLIARLDLENADDWVVIS